MSYSQKVIHMYLEQLTKKERVTYDIARNHLGSSFNLLESIGFQKWISQLNISEALPDSDQKKSY